VESREYNGRWYTDVKAWKVLGKQQSGGPSQGSNFSSAPMAGNTTNSADADDDLPF
jgi:hypothetical protein